jgi:hypothetical protein
VGRSGGGKEPPLGEEEGVVLDSALLIFVLKTHIFAYCHNETPHVQVSVSPSPVKSEHNMLKPLAAKHSTRAHARVQYEYAPRSRSGLRTTPANVMRVVQWGR